MTEQKIYTVLGLMSGTSLDGMDAAIIKTDGHKVVSFGPFETRSYRPEFRDRLRAELGRKAAPKALEAELTELHAELVKDLLTAHSLSARDIDVIGFHGQTLHHEPANNFTLQIGDGAKLAKLTGCTVVNNFRAADVAAGGEGAPLAPVYHRALAAELRGPVAIVNIGGVANVSFVGVDCLIAFDTGPGNAAIDDVVRQKTGADFDASGGLAKSGQIDQAVLARLLNHTYFDQTPPKSLDRNAFDFSGVKDLSVEDAAATLVAFTVESLAKAARHFPEPVLQWLVAGGGRHNLFMMDELATHVGAEVRPVESVGWDGDALEAQAFGFMALRSMLKLPLSFPGTTGVPQELTGGDIHPR